MLGVRGAGEDGELPLSKTRKKRAPSKPNFLLLEYSPQELTTSSRTSRSTALVPAVDGGDRGLLPLRSKDLQPDLALLPSVSLPGKRAPQLVSFGHVDGDEAALTGTINSKGFIARNGLDSLYWALIDVEGHGGSARFNPVAVLQTFVSNDGASSRVDPTRFVEVLVNGAHIETYRMESYAGQIPKHLKHPQGWFRTDWCIYGALRRTPLASWGTLLL